MAKLENLKQEMFCRHYITEIDGKPFNATSAATKAGYSEKTASQAASRLLRNVKIVNRILELMKNSMK
jgi:phage terminase small subunit